MQGCGPGLALTEADEKYARSPATTEYIEFEGRPHLLMAAERWEDVAASIDSWLDGVLEAVPYRPAVPPRKRAH